MSERPAKDARIISELYGFERTDEYDSRAAENAIERVMEERPELEEFCRWAHSRHEETRGNVGDGLRSWRDFRNVVVRDEFSRRFDEDEILERINEEINETDE